MVKNLLIFLLFGGDVQVNANRAPNPPHRTQDRNNGSEATLPVTLPQKDDGPTLQADPNKEERGSKSKPVWIGGMPPKDPFDWTAYYAGLVLTCVGIGGIIVAFCTLKKIERQTAATEKQATHMVTSERPFIMIETRGEKGTEFWIRNCGRSPAQILFIDRLLIPQYPEWIQNKQQYVLPYPPEYGNNYDDNRYEQINLQWLAQGDDRYFASFDPAILEMLPIETKGELNQGGRAVRIYSSVKYRGMFSPNIYHSRFCYGWTPNGGTYMTGPAGYNEYT